MSGASTVAPRDITGDEFRAISQLMHERSGVRLVTGKEPLVMGRLARRLRQLGLTSYGEYLRLLHLPGQDSEVRLLVDLLTTNETFFFREGRHFEFLRRVVVPAHRPGRPLRLWSAASSTGEEAYTAAMVLAEAMRGAPWEIVGTDVSSRVVETARRGLYPLSAADRIPTALLRRYCRKGRDEYEGIIAVSRELRDGVTFRHANLLDDLRGLGQFDVVLLRNAMIYFDAETRAGLVQRVQEMLRPGGYLIVSLSESLTGMSSRLRMVEPSIYRLDHPARPPSGRR